MDKIKGKSTWEVAGDPFSTILSVTAEISKLLYDLRQDPKKYLTIRFHIF
jgi:hypothetical protein